MEIFRWVGWVQDKDFPLAVLLDTAGTLASTASTCAPYTVPQYAPQIVWEPISRRSMIREGERDNRRVHRGKHTT